MRFFSVKSIIALCLLAGVFFLPDPFSDERFPFPDGLYIFDGQTRVNFETSRDSAIDEVSLILWPGEHEAFQVLISKDDGPGNVFVNAWLNPYSGDEIENQSGDADEIHRIASPPGFDVYMEHYVEIEKKNISRGKTGSYPDALIPWPLGEFREVGDGGFLTLYIRISSDETTPPGIYHGRVQLNVDERATEIDFDVEILDVQIDTDPLPVAIGASSSSLKRFLPDESSSGITREDIYLQFASQLLEARACPIGLDVLTHPEISTVDGAREYSYDRTDLTFSYFSKAARIQFPFTFNDISGSSSIAAAPMMSHPWRRDVSAYISEVAGHLRDSGQMERTFCYIIDEPNSILDYNKVLKFGALLDDAAPDLDFLVTEQPYLLPGQEDWPSLDSAVDIWCPQLGFYRTEECTYQQNAGKEVWIYPNQRDFIRNEPEILSPTLNIGDEFLAPRLLTALIYRHNIDGLLYWECLYWRHVDPYVNSNPSGDTDREFFGNGDGYLFYPGDDISIHHHGFQDQMQPMPSLRWMNLVEGLEDYRLLKFAGFDPSEIPESRELLDNPGQYQAIIDQVKIGLLAN